MHVHRSHHSRGFTVLPNVLLQDRRLSYTARGLLVDLLSRPDGWSEDGRRMADSSPQGRLCVGRALRELRAAGYYVVTRTRLADGTCVTETHVYDSPQLAPNITRPGPGRPKAGDTGGKPTKQRGKETSLPVTERPVAEKPVTKRPAAQAPPEAPEAPEEAGAATAPEPPPEVIGAAAATLMRVVGTEPALRIGTLEALRLAPLAAEWLRRGYGEKDLARALLAGLPATVHSAAALLRDRLTRKLPPPKPARKPKRPVVRRWTEECGSCGRPVTGKGLCRLCAERPAPTAPTAPTEPAEPAPARSAREQVRAALEGRPRSFPGARGRRAHPMGPSASDSSREASARPR